MSESSSDDEEEKDNPRDKNIKTNNKADSKQELKVEKENK